jgi:choline monooxygenase
MSDLPSSRLQLVQSSPQLPVSWYFDQRIFDAEMKALFGNGPGYVGHELMVPNPGDYHTLSWTDHARMLVRNASGVQLLSNICRHRQAIMLEGRGNTQHLVCPLHRWTYDLHGSLIGAPHFPENPCVALGATALQNWNGLLFAGKRDIAADLSDLAVKPDLDFSGYVFDRVEIHDCNYNWKTFIEV